MNVILYIMDCLRADRLGCYGNPKSNTPNLDKFSTEAVLFENAHAQATWTYPSGASIFSGMYPSSLGVQLLDNPLPTNMPWWPELFQNNDYITACFSANVLISETFGFRRGFDIFVDQLSDPNLSRYRLPVVMLPQYKEIAERYVDLSDLVVVTSDDLHRAFTKFVKRRFNQPFFAVIWAMDTHDPYFDRTDLGSGVPNPLYYQPDIVQMQDPKKLAELSALYDRMVQYNDRTFGELLRMLNKLGLYEETIIIVTGDHGEAFGEHGIMTHSGRPYEVQTHVPLLIKFPHSKLGGARHTDIVQVIDVFPTLLNYLQLKEEDRGYVQGTPLLNGNKSRHAMAWSEGRGYLSLRAERWRYIRPQHIYPRGKYRGRLRRIVRYLSHAALFDLIHDPAETRDVSVRYLPWHAWLAGKAQTMWRKNQKIRQNMVFASQAIEPSDLVEDRLRALGYIE
jgi:arylsulfatase A-like enzyme